MKLTIRQADMTTWTMHRGGVEFGWTKAVVGGWLARTCEGRKSLWKSRRRAIEWLRAEARKWR